MTKPRRTLRSKFVAVAGTFVVTGLALTVGVSVRGARELSQRSSEEIERGIKEQSEEYLQSQLDVVGRANERILGPARNDLDIVTDFGQALIDHEEEYAELFAGIERTPAFRPVTDLEPKGRFRENRPGAPAAIGIWKPLLDEHGNIRPEIERRMVRDGMFDVVMPIIQQNGVSKLQVYHVGPRGADYIRLTPWVRAAAESERNYPGSSEGPFWEFFFPGLVESWDALIADPARFAARSRDTVYTPPYNDSAGGGLVISLFRPLWTKDRKRFAGGMGIDLTLSKIIQNIESVRLEKSGFAFLVQADGNVLAINDRGVRTFRLRGSDAGQQGVTVLFRKLGQSELPAIAALKASLPDDDLVHFADLSIGGEEHVLALRRHARLDTWLGKEGVRPENWTLGFVVPKSEIYASLRASQRVVAATNRSIITAQIGITLATLLAVLAGIVIVARRMTAPLTALTEAARKLRDKDYDVTVTAASDDEIGELGGAFGAMVGEIRDHTQNLETLVKKRTEELDRTLAELWSEMDLARKLQTVLLPGDAQLGEHDIAAKMVPASNVGGDYYDFFPAPSGKWALVGDVSGHGVTSGLIMMMAQTAVRATVLGGSADLSPSRVLSRVNGSIRANLERIGKSQYMTISALRVDGATVHHAGLHQDILVYRAESGAVDAIETDGIWLGLLDDIEPLLTDASFTIAPGDIVLLYTDGITEAKVENGRLGIAALTKLFQEVAPRATSSRAVVDDLFARLPVQTFDDDVTIMAIRRKPSESSPPS